MADATEPPAPQRRRGHTLLLVAGYAALGLGLLGAFVPLLPTTVFLIIAVACFVRANPRLARRLLRDRRSGAALRQFLRHGAISRPAKFAAVGGMALGFVATSTAFGWHLVPVVITAALLLCAATFVVTRPAPPAAGKPR